MIEKIIQNLLNKSIKNCFNEEFKSVVRSSNKICDYQCDDCFSLSKKLKNSPVIIANRIVDNLKECEDFNKYFTKVEVAGPGFINFVLTDEFIDKTLDQISNNNFGVEKPENPQLFFLDYGGPNVAKPLHVGHLRSHIIGESVKRIINFSGNKTISDVHFGDFGLQIGEIIYGLKERNINPNNITLALLNEIYPNMSERIKIDSVLYEKCAQITKDLQDGKTENLDYFKIIYEVSVNDIKRLYKYLDINLIINLIN